MRKVTGNWRKFAESSPDYLNVIYLLKWILNKIFYIGINKVVLRVGDNGFLMRVYTLKVIVRVLFYY